MERNPEILYAGIAGHVVAIDAVTGDEVWRQKLPKASGVMSMLLKGDFLYVGAGGYVYCLDRYLGELRWKNDLKRLGWEAVLLTLEGATSQSADASLVAATAAAAAAQAAASAG